MFHKFVVSLMWRFAVSILVRNRSIVLSSGVPIVIVLICVSVLLGWLILTRSRAVL